METFWVVTLVGVEARDAAKHPTMHGTTPVMPKNSLVPNYGVEKNPAPRARYPLPPPCVFLPVCLHFHGYPGQLTRTGNCEALCAPSTLNFNMGMA